MSVNTMTFEQSAAFLTELYKEASGKEPTIQVADTGTFTSVATTLLQMGYDPIISALTQVLDRTIFSIRPYEGKFASINVDSNKWGAITRKINFLDSDVEDDDRLNLEDGKSVDPYIVKKPKVLQTNFYGQHQYQQHITIFRDQLDSAFKDADSFGRFISGVLQNIRDQLEQVREAEARATVLNFIGGKVAGDSANVINVLQVYKDMTGTTITPETMFNPDNYTTFSRWLAGYLLNLQDNMAERSIKYHMNVTGKEIMRHTPSRFLKKLVTNSYANFISTAVESNLFNPDRLGALTQNTEKVTFWQNIDSPYDISVKPTYLNVADGSLTTATDDVTLSNVLGVFFDEEALGINRKSTWTASSPFNPRGGYYNIFWHMSQQFWNDFSENATVLYAGETT